MSPIIGICLLLLPIPLLIVSLWRERTVFLCLLTLSGVVSSLFFVYMQTVLNTPDEGKLFPQFYLPLLVYLTITVSAVCRLVKKARRSNPK